MAMYKMHGARYVDEQWKREFRWRGKRKSPFFFFSFLFLTSYTACWFMQLIIIAYRRQLRLTDICREKIIQPLITAAFERSRQPKV